ncbi:MAG TPA: SPW repeat protein, partial [Flavobacterium sp.]|nr:SPW repeat protein [Flavobacterium sp.]
PAWKYFINILMRVLTTRAHGIMDYLMGILLIAAPWLFDFARGGAETWVPVVLGAGAILYSLITDYEYSVSKTISMRTHLTLDLLSGILLAASPWLFGFSDFVYLPHLILGILEIGASLMTERAPSTGNARTHHRHAH